MEAPRKIEGAVPMTPPFRWTGIAAHPQVSASYNVSNEDHHQHQHQHHPSVGVVIPVNHLELLQQQHVNRHPSSTSSNSSSSSSSVAQGSRSSEVGDGASVQSKTAQGSDMYDKQKSQPHVTSCKSQASTPADHLTQHQIDSAHSVTGLAYPYMDPYFGGILTTYGAQALIHPHMFGVQQARIPLRMDTEEEPILVNAKQYRGILRRRQIRAKAELENKVVKVRKPYLHESRHLHATRRERGSGGRFLNTRKMDNLKTNNVKGKEEHPINERPSASNPKNVSERLLQDVQSSTSAMSSSEVTSLSRSYTDDENYLFPRNDGLYCNSQLQEPLHMSVFHLSSGSDEGESRGGTDFVTNGSQRQRAVAIL